MTRAEAIKAISDRITPLDATSFQNKVPEDTVLLLDIAITLRNIAELSKASFDMNELILAQLDRQGEPRN